MESDFRTGFRNTVSHVKVKKDETPLIIETVVEPKKIEVPKVELPEKIIEEKEVVKTEIIVEEPKEVVQVTEQEEFESLDLNSEELMEIKKLALKDILSEDLAISELVDLVLLSKKNKPVKEKNFENLLIREYVDNDGKITKTGRMYLEFDDVKARLRKIVK